MISESDIEQWADAAIMRRLRTDSAYVHAENAEEQAIAEERIAIEEWARICRKHGREDLLP